MLNNYIKDFVIDFIDVMDDDRYNIDHLLDYFRQYVDEHFIYHYQGMVFIDEFIWYIRGDDYLLDEFNQYYFKDIITTPVLIPVITLQLYGVDLLYDILCDINIDIVINDQTKKDMIESINKLY